MSIVTSVARQVGRAPIAAIYDWAKANAQNQVGAQIEWLREGSVRDDVIVQAPEFRALSDAMERMSEKITTKETVRGILVGADTKSRRFHFIADGTEESIRGKFADAISESQQAHLPARYHATLTKTTEISFATEKENVDYFLERLELASR